MTLPYVDTAKKSKAYAVGLRYCARILEEHNTSVDSVTDDELREIFATHRLRKPAGAKLSYGSVKYVLSILKRARPDEIALTMGQLERDAIVTPQLNYLRRFTPDTERRVKETILFFVRILAKCHTRADYLRSAPLYDTCLAVVLTLATNLRSSELKQITFEHVARIFNRQPVSIRVKMRCKSIVIVANLEMLKLFLPQIKVIGGGDRAKPLLSASVSTINRLFREAFENTTATSDDRDDWRIGLQAIRKINTTVLIEHGTLKLAQAFNRHASSEITDKYYNTQNYISNVVNRVFTAA